ncbi:4-hydroxybenzoate polyprenyltransferase: mitochondrial-like isoform X1 [Dinothrombium tinctorium]|uniref:4-hydroxybenzoate polyprenyltransferase, mitochondrial n=1 Tax=Dinothrombium tinctorium TaxID=1965070 RepID=A0A443RL38_9ACAR|nr:4-hydroxybenzoate polyprenyltransferase: mitochondrial-like isoform X1 [Dinothrombium tinctorium]
MSAILCRVFLNCVSKQNSNLLKCPPVTSVAITSYGDRYKAASEKATNKSHRLQPLIVTKDALSSTIIKMPTESEKFVRRFPTSFQPYLEAMRVDKPIGTMLLLWPCYWSIGLATTAGKFPDITLLGLFACGAFLMRGAGCIINDMYDKDLDKSIQRTKGRPFASGRLSLLDGTMFLGGQLGAALIVLLQFDLNTILLGASSLALVCTYPLVKRFTHWPQLILGMAFNWGALLGWSAATNGELFLPAVLPLYTAGIFWTLIYDTIYAHQDRKDDLILGIKSTAIKFGDKTKQWLSLFSIGMISSLTLVGINTAQMWPFYVSVAAAAAHLGKQISTLNINDSEDCWKKFNSNHQLGLILFLGIILSTVIKQKPKKNES